MHSDDASPNGQLLGDCRREPFLGAALDDPALVLGDRAERAATHPRTTSGSRTVTATSYVSCPLPKDVDTADLSSSAWWAEINGRILGHARRRSSKCRKMHLQVAGRSQLLWASSADLRVA